MESSSDQMENIPVDKWSSCSANDCLKSGDEFVEEDAGFHICSILRTTRGRLKMEDKPGGTDNKVTKRYKDKRVHFSDIVDVFEERIDEFGSLDESSDFSCHRGLHLTGSTTKRMQVLQPADCIYVSDFQERYNTYNKCLNVRCDRQKLSLRKSFRDFIGSEDFTAPLATMDEIDLFCDESPDSSSNDFEDDEDSPVSQEYCLLAAEAASVSQEHLLLAAEASVSVDSSANTDERLKVAASDMNTSDVGASEDFSSRDAGTGAYVSVPAALPVAHESSFSGAFNYDTTEDLKVSDEFAVAHDFVVIERTSLKDEFVMIDRVPSQDKLRTAEEMALSGEAKAVMDFEVVEEFIISEESEESLLPHDSASEDAAIVSEEFPTVNVARLEMSLAEHSGALCHPVEMSGDSAVSGSEVSEERATLDRVESLVRKDNGQTKEGKIPDCMSYDSPNGNSDGQSPSRLVSNSTERNKNSTGPSRIPYLAKHQNILDSSSHRGTACSGNETVLNRTLDSVDAVVERFQCTLIPNLVWLFQCADK